MTAVKIDRSLILKAYKKAGKRILFLDYDGTLVPFNDLPEQSELGEKTGTIIHSLVQDPANHVFIISGRERRFLSRQFQAIPVGLIAEHGLFIKEVDGEWMQTVPVDCSWKNEVITFFHELSLFNPGSFCEEKESSVAYHYRTAGQQTEETVKPLIRRKFLSLRKEYPGLELMDGVKVTEIKPAGFNKGRIVSAILGSGKFDFILAAGDDLTDERLFAVIDRDAFTIKIGFSPTAARFFVIDQEEFIDLLKELQVLSV